MGKCQFASSNCESVDCHCVFLHAGHSRVLLQMAGVVPPQLLLEVMSCPYCVRALESMDLEIGDSDYPRSERDVVYEFSYEAEFITSHSAHYKMQEKQNRLVQFWGDFRDRLIRIVDSKYFNRGIMIAILINTLSMGIEYHEQVSTSVGSFMNILHLLLVQCCRDDIFLYQKPIYKLAFSTSGWFLTNLAGVWLNG